MAAPVETVPGPAGSQTTTIPLGNKPFATPFYSIGREICQNLYLENAITEYSKMPYYLLKIPGLRRFGSIPTTNLGACRQLFTASNGRTFTVNGNRFSEVLIDGTVSFIGYIQSYSGQVSMAENGKLLMIVDGIAGYILRFTDNNFTRITDQYFPGVDPGTDAPTHVTFVLAYFIVNVPNSNQYYYSTPYYVRDHDDTSSPYDPAEPNGYWTPLSSGQKSGRPDNLTAIANCNNYLWLFGSNSCEVHYDTGNFEGQLFARYQGAVLNIGTSAKYSIAVYANNIFWLGSDLTGTLGVFTNDGFNPVRISTRGIEQIIESMGDWSDVKSWVYAQSGHSFYVMHFPTGNKTFVYDMTTSAWHERTRQLDVNSSAIIRWDGLYATSNWDSIIMGDVNSSALYILDPTYYQNDNAMDAGVNYIRCEKNTPISFDQGKQVRYNWVQVICNQGSGTTLNTPAGVGQDPQVWVKWFDDTGIVPSSERKAPIGKIGEYKKRSIIYACGTSRNRSWSIYMTDPVPFILVAIIVNGSTNKF